MPRILSENKQDISVLHDCGSRLAFINTLQPGDHIFLDSAFRIRKQRAYRARCQVRVNRRHMAEWYGVDDVASR